MILLILPLAFVSISDASETIEYEIYDFARGSYDLLVRPSESHSIIEDELELVEENYLGIGDGGITIEQWQQISERDDVEIAAPVAAVGLFTAPEITVQLPPSPNDTSLRYEAYSITSDGVNEYELTSPLTAYTIRNKLGGDELVEVMDDELASIFSASYPSYPLPPSFHQVVAVDIDEEAALTGMDLQNLNYSSGFVPEGYEEIPILSLNRVTTPVKTILHMEEINDQPGGSLDSIINYYLSMIDVPYYDLKFIGHNHPEILDKLMEELSEIPAISSEEHVLDFTQKVTPFYDNFLFTDEKYNVWTYEDREQFDFDLGGSINHLSQKSSYSLSPVNYDIRGDNVSIQLVNIDEESGVPIYRELKETEHYKTAEYSAEVIEGEGFSFVHAGNFEWEAEEEVLAASPLGIYGIQETYLADNHNQSVHPTAVPGSFISTPAHGLISMDYAELIKGDSPIDAIRVKISGIDGYDEESASKIRSIAEEIEGQGFTVDIVAGASHQNLTIEVEELGEVIQPWTTLGAADTIVKSWDLVRIVLVILFTTVSFVYFLYSSINLLKERQANEAQLKYFGWSNKHIRYLRYKEVGGLIGFPAALAFFCLLVYSSFNEIRGSLLWLTIIISIMIGVFLLLFIFINKSNEPKVIKPSKLPIYIQNTFFHKGRIIAASVQLVFLTFTSIFLILLLQHEEKRTIQTTLGIHIHGQMDTFYFILVSLIFTLSFLTVLETLLSLWKRRVEEFKLFYQIGWGKKKSYQFYLKEVSFWVFTSILLGALVSAVCYFIFIGPIFNDIITVALMTINILVSVMTLSVLVFSFMLWKYTSYWDWRGAS